MGYCEVDDVRVITGLSTSDISDANLTNLIDRATTKINRDILVYHEDEKVRHVNIEKKNLKNGENTIFYTRYFPVGDLTNNGEVGTSDIWVYQINSNGSRDEDTLTISNIRERDGRFMLETAPASGKRLWITYRSAPFGIQASTDELVKQACEFLAAAMSFSRIDAKLYDRFRLGKLTMMAGDSRVSKFMGKYKKTLAAINAMMAKTKRASNLI